MSSSLSYNNNEWHTVKFTRQGSKGRLIVDGADESEGESFGTARTMQLVSPMLIGGLSQEDVEDAALNLKVRYFMQILGLFFTANILFRLKKTTWNVRAFSVASKTFWLVESQLTNRLALSMFCLAQVKLSRAFSLKVAM